MKPGTLEQRIGHGAIKLLSAVETYKKQKIIAQLCLFLFSKNFDLKNNNKNYRKPFRVF